MIPENGLYGLIVHDRRRRTSGSRIAHSALPASGRKPTATTDTTSSQSSSQAGEQRRTTRRRPQQVDEHQDHDNQRAAAES
jgi:hypothetical protein